MVDYFLPSEMIQLGSL